MRVLTVYVHEDMPPDVLESMNLEQRVLENVPGGPLGRAIASRWLRGKTPREIAELIRRRAPKDAREQWRKVDAADGLAFIAPVFWLHFPAILKGWFERVFAYGSAYALTREGWEGRASGRVPLMHQDKALIMTPTLFCEADYKADWEQPMRRIIDDWGLRYPGVKHVEHVFFYGAAIADPPQIRAYLHRARELGRDFAVCAPATALAAARTRKERANVTAEAFPTLSPEQLRRRSVGNLLRMGHCAPTVMQTMIDASGGDARWLVLLMAGLPGGIANTGSECGGLTAPLVQIGLRHGRDETEDGLPVVVEKGHDLLERFTARCGTTQCREILGDARLPLRCVGVVREAPAMCAQCIAASNAHAIPPEARQAYRELSAHWRQQGFHCADAVFAGLDTTGAPAELADAVSGFMGGTVFAGMTCSALTAGVMALGLALGEIEDSRPRVARMIATMALGGNAFADDLNKFNRLMNLGHDLATWFEAQFGSTQCRTLTGCDFATADGVHAYIEHDGTSECARIAHLVAGRVAEVIAASESGSLDHAERRGDVGAPQLAQREQGRGGDHDGPRQ